MKSYSPNSDLHKQVISDIYSYCEQNKIILSDLVDIERPLTLLKVVQALSPKYISIIRNEKKIELQFKVGSKRPKRTTNEQFSE